MLQNKNISPGITTAEIFLKSGKITPQAFTHLTASILLISVFLPSKRT